MSVEATAFTAGGEARGAKVELPLPLFDGTVHEGVLHQVVTALQANRRQGTASTRTRGRVAGGSRKPWRQKGTGRARHGSIRSPIWRGGGITFGPLPRDFDVRVPRKVKRLAIQSALNARALEGRLLVLEPLPLEKPSTRTVATVLEKMGIADEAVLLLTDGYREVVHLSGRNLPRLEVRPWGEASAYDLLRAGVVVVEEGAWEAERREDDEEVG